MINEFTSYELSKRLHELGFKGEHGYVWDRNKELWRIEQSDDKHNILAKLVNGDGCWLICSDPNCKEHDGSAIPAYTFTELWAVLPEGINVNHSSYHIHLTKGALDLDGKVCVSYTQFDLQKEEFKYAYSCDASSRAEAAGLMVEWLIKEKYLEVK